MTRYQQDKAQYMCEWFTNWFRRILAERRLTAQDFSNLTGLNQSTILDYRTGVRSPNLKTFLMMLDVLGLEIRIAPKNS